MNLLKQAVELKQAQDAAAPKKSLIEKIKGFFRRQKGKRAYEALKAAKRAEKAAQVKSNLEKADELQVRSDALLEESALCYRSDPAKSEQLLEEATTLAVEASALRQAA